MTYNIWIVNSDQTVCYWNGAAGWTQVPGSLTQIAAGGDGEVWGVDSQDHAFRWNGTGFTQIPYVFLAQVAVGSGQVWGVDGNDKVFRYHGGGFLPIAGSMMSLAVGDDGQVWGIDRQHQIYRWNGLGWTQVAGSLVSIAVASDGQVWGTNAQQQIYRWSGSAWTQVAGSLDKIATGSDMVWGLLGGQLYRTVLPAGWTQLSGSNPSVKVVSVAVASPPAPTPAVFVSNHNYILSSDCKPVTGLSVTVDVTWQMVASAGAGFSVQLNASSAPNHDYTYQQYCIAVDGSRTPPQIECAVYNWPKDSTHFLIGQNYDLCTLPTADFPAGWQLSISLGNDGNGNVNAATFTVVDQTGTTMASRTVVLLSTKNQHGDAIVSSDLAPITFFEVDIVGRNGGLRTQFTYGTGTITYRATTPLTPLSKAPKCTDSTTPGTAETSNCKYGLLPFTQKKTLVQSFLCEDGLPAWAGPA